MNLLQKNKMRKEAFAGQFYPSDKEELQQMVSAFLVSEKKENVHSIIVPHAGYAFSGKLAGMTYSLVPQKKNFIILGVNHTGLGAKICFSMEDWKTPLGTIKTNKDLAEKILHKLKHADLETEINEITHKQEHSIEVQLPFLQLSQTRFEIVPIMFSGLDYDECKKIAEVLKDFVNDKVMIIVSSDFTHHGKTYGFEPFTNDIKNNMAKLDGDMILHILKNDSKSFFHLANKSTVCGLYGITVLTEISKLKKWKPRLIEYHTSGDMTNKWDMVVGYAGLVFE